jgi:16S rRNA (guanine527-N7)-methyltransferase
MLQELYEYWNARINVISRKDIDKLEERHILHSLSIAKVISFRPGTSILDVGTGGGFPGIPLAILFPDSDFLLVDSIGKKVKVVKEIAAALGLKNAEARQVRAEQLEGRFDFAVSRAVTNLPEFLSWTKHMIRQGKRNSLDNGILYLKGGDFEDELSRLDRPYAVYDLDISIPRDFFLAKKLVYISFSAKVEK